MRAPPAGSRSILPADIGGLEASAAWLPKFVPASAATLSRTLGAGLFRVVGGLCLKKAVAFGADPVVQLDLGFEEVDVAFLIL